MQHIYYIRSRIGKQGIQKSLPIEINNQFNYNNLSYSKILGSFEEGRGANIQQNEDEIENMNDITTTSKENIKRYHKVEDEDELFTLANVESIPEESRASCNTNLGSLVTDCDRQRKR